MKTYPYIEISNVDDLPKPATGTNLIVHYVFQYVDFRKVPEYAEENTFIDCCFFGCTLPPAMHARLESCLVLPRMGMKFRSFSNGLYDGKSLYEGFDPEHEETQAECFDSRIYADYKEQGKRSEDIRVMLARSLHDYSIADSMHDFLSHYDSRDVIGIMGGHALKRTDPMYRNIVLMSKSLTEKGKLMVSGGGPGAMEATHLGAWLACRSSEDVDDALNILSVAPVFTDAHWLRSAFEVIEKYPQRRYHSLGIPTWLYGHEPATPFATDIAKFFENSVREDTILAIAEGGLIFTPGSAGTMQEIFQAAAQNHYHTCQYVSPMVFFGADYYTEVLPVYPMLETLQSKGQYKNLLLTLTDDPEEVVNVLMTTEIG